MALAGRPRRWKCGLQIPVLPLLHISGAQAGQDLFTIAMTQGKENGTWLELGAWDPHIGNNTYVLEKKFNWTGVSVDCELTGDWSQRPNTNIIVSDAFKLNPNDLDEYYDFLQVDIDPAEANYSLLEKITRDIRFGVIAYEHNAWMDSDVIQADLSRSRRLLADRGYELVVNDVTIDPKMQPQLDPNIIYWFEDWYVDPKIIDRRVIDYYKWIDFSSKPKYFNDILFNMV